MGGRSGPSSRTLGPWLIQPIPGNPLSPQPYSHRLRGDQAAAMDSHDAKESVVNLPSVEVSQSPVDKFREYLASRPGSQRFTEPQRVMIEFIFSKHEHFDANQLEEEMKQSGLNVSRPTIYRTLSKLVDAGLLRELDVGTRKHYEHDYGRHQHDHMHCESCNDILEFHDPVVKELIEKVANQHNFQVDGYSFVIRGVCSKCNRKRSVKRKLDMV